MQGPFRRFKKDPRIILVDTFSDIPTCEELNNIYDANGVLCPYEAFSAHEEREVTDYMRDKYQGDIHTVRSHYCDIPAPLDRVFFELCDVFDRFSGEKSNGELRANSLYPDYPHNHPGDLALTYTFAGLGTVGVNEYGYRYITPHKHIFMFDEAIEHMASQRLPKDHLKLTILVT